jgi:hypothetical protein
MRIITALVRVERTLVKILAKVARTLEVILARAKVVVLKILPFQKLYRLREHTIMYLKVWSNAAVLRLT